MKRVVLLNADCCLNLRLDSNRSQTEASADMGICEKYIRDCEKGRPVNILTWDTISSYYNVPKDSLLIDENPSYSIKFKGLFTEEQRYKVNKLINSLVNTCCQSTTENKFVEDETEYLENTVL